MRLSVLFVLVAVLFVPGARAATPETGDYWYGAALASRAQIEFELLGTRGTIADIAKVKCLDRYVRLAPRTFTVRNSRFQVTVPLQTISAAGTVDGRVNVTGHWTSRTSVSGRLRLVTLRPRSTAVACDSGPVAWRAALDAVVKARASAPKRFPIPGTQTTTVVVSNDGDYPSADTRVSLEPTMDVGVNEFPGKKTPARPTPRISASKGSCQWPVRVKYEGYATQPGRVILCRLGRLAPHTSATITVAEAWTVDSCVPDEYGSSEPIWAAWDAAVKSPLHMHGWALFPTGSPHPLGTCPDQPPEE
jgi:hypothetical protein